MTWILAWVSSILLSYLVVRGEPQVLAWARATMGLCGSSTLEAFSANLMVPASTSQRMGN